MAKTNRAMIIDAAGALIMETGRSSISLSEVAQKLGITHAAIYGYFQNKQGLWEAVAEDWFQQTILQNLPQYTASLDSRQFLHDWLWAFASAKKQAAQLNPQMFALNTAYVDSNPEVLRRVLKNAFVTVNQIMGYQDDQFEVATTLLSAFSVFFLPSFKDSWNSPDYYNRFETLWQIVSTGLFD